MIAGIIFIALGVLVRFFPNLLAGFNQLSNKERDKAKQNGLPKFASYILIGMGLINLLGYFYSIWLDQPSLTGTITTFTAIVGMVILVVFGNLIANRRTS
jgi:membrane associated rhomboid family serine protease